MKMQQINMKTTGTPDVLFIEETEIPQPQAGEILVKVAYAGALIDPTLCNAKAYTQCRKGLHPLWA